MNRFSRITVVGFAFLLATSSCGSSDILEDEPPPTTASSTETTLTPTTTSEVEPGESTTSTAPTPTTTVARPPLIDGLPAPAIRLVLDDETTLDLPEAYEPVVLFFWATWCHNCHEMMPLIDQLSVDYEGRATVVAVARLSTLHEIENDVIEYLPSGATRWVSDDSNRISEVFRIPGNPVSILVVGGVEANRWLGMTPVIDIQNRLDEVLGLYR